MGWLSNRLPALPAVAAVAHMLLTSMRHRRRELAILKTLGFVTRQVRTAVAWQATAIATSSLPLGTAAGRWAWSLFATQVAIEPTPVISPLVLFRSPRRPGKVSRISWDERLVPRNKINK
jgi:ABC-type lipoprotein release transport system permease subunit